MLNSFLRAQESSSYRTLVLLTGICRIGAPEMGKNQGPEQEWPVALAVDPPAHLVSCSVSYSTLLSYSHQPTGAQSLILNDSPAPPLLPAILFRSFLSLLSAFPVLDIHCWFYLNQFVEQKGNRLTENKLVGTSGRGKKGGQDGYRDRRGTNYYE